MVLWLVKGSLKIMKILVTGSSGYVGSAFVGHLGRDPDIQVIGVDRIPPSAPTPLNFQFLKIDLSATKINWPSIELDGVHAVVHLAAARGDWNLSSEDYFRDNLTATQNMLSAPWAKNVEQWILMSSVSVYGPSEYPMDECSPCFPVGAYGESKLASEKNFLKFVRRHKKNFCIIRPSAIFSAGHPHNTNVYKLIESLRTAPVPLIEAGKNRKSLTYLPNLLQLIEWALNEMDNGRLNSKIYNYVEEPVLSVAELISTLRDVGIHPAQTLAIPLWLPLVFSWPVFLLGQLLGIDLRITPERVRKYASSTCYDSSLVKQDGFQPKASLYEGLQATAKWHISNPKPHFFL